MGVTPYVGGVWLEHHGSFRIRPELLLGGDLGVGTSGVPEPLAAATGDDSDASTLSWASMRIRYEPILHIGRNLTVHLGIDALDNLVLGSTHEATSDPVAIDLTNDAAASPSAGRNGWRDALRVRSLYGRWFAFDFFDLRVGRMPDPFGIGVSRNDGECPDCDYGTIVDAMRVGFELSGFRVEGSWEFTAVGATTAQLTDVGDQGQDKDLGQSDDVQGFTITIGRRPVTDAQLEERRVALDEKREWVFDWSVFSSFTDQQLSSLEPIADTSVSCSPSQVLANGQPVTRYECMQLYRRGAFFWRPGLWFHLERHPTFDESLRLDIELQGLVGNVTHPQRLEEADSQEAKDFLGFGGAVELEYQSDAWHLGFDGGFATGDDGDYVGVLDGQNIVEPDDDAYAQNDNVRDNRKVTSFFFNRDYRVDLILFRQVLGTITNTVYFKPWIARDLLRMDGGTLTARLDVLYAMAAVPEGTPGDGRSWGVEVDGRLGLKLDMGLETTLAAGVLIPLDALDNADTGKSPDPAFTVQILGTMKF
ncbi:MAG: hypothetical protein KC635_06690 [Myxococcales bacterium]|nr:hypothetical protein [Myxococcales bacterium]MCB9733132.1 hypothetical protein [Deltaproteobacteria bacterium]